MECDFDLLKPETWIWGKSVDKSGSPHKWVKIDKFCSFSPGKLRYRAICQCVFDWDGDKTNSAVGL